MARGRTLLFYTHALAGGGAERVLARLASGFASRGDRVVFAVDFEANENLAYLSPEVDLRVLPRGHVRATLALARILRQERPAASLSGISVSNLKHTVAAVLAGRSSRAILSYHGFYEQETQGLSNIGYRLTPVLMRLTRATIAVSKVLHEDLIIRFRAPKSRLRMIYNPAAPEQFPRAVSREDITRRAPVVLAIGRLVPDKDFLSLIRAFARVTCEDARLVILGEGSERGRLVAEARTLGVEERVEMPGFVRDTGAQFDRARCFVVSSRSESFSLACVEALAHGLPVAITDCGGPREILDGLGVVKATPVGDAAALALAIDALLADPGQPAPRQERARVFSLEAALVAYEREFSAIEITTRKSG